MACAVQPSVGRLQRYVLYLHVEKIQNQLATIEASAPIQQNLAGLGHLEACHDRRRERGVAELFLNASTLLSACIDPLQDPLARDLCEDVTVPAADCAMDQRDSPVIADVCQLRARSDRVQGVHRHIGVFQEPMTVITGEPFLARNQVDCRIDLGNPCHRRLDLGPADAPRGREQLTVQIVFDEDVGIDGDYRPDAQAGQFLDDVPPPSPPQPMTATRLRKRRSCSPVVSISRLHW